MSELVVSNIHLVLQEHLNQFESRLPKIHTVYDESLSYETAIARYRANNDLGQDSQEAFPLFAFNRSVLRYAPQGIGRRSVTKRPMSYEAGDDTATIYKSVFGEFDISYLFVTPMMSDIENFEISYLGEESVGSEKEFNVRHSDMGDFPYYVTMEPLDDLRVNIDGSYYKAVGGRSVIRGFFFIVKGTSKIIKEIGLQVKTFNEEVLCGTTIN